VRFDSAVVNSGDPCQSVGSTPTATPYSFNEVKRMSEYNIPDNVQELFANGECSYSIIDPDQPGDNIFSLRLFLECVGVPSEMIEEDLGTQVTLCDGTKRIVIDSGGLGDFHRHGYDVTVGEIDVPVTTTRPRLL